MSDGGKRRRHLKKTAKVLSVIGLAVICILLLAVVAFNIYLATALPASQLSRYVTSYLHQKFTVKSLRSSGTTLILKGVRLQNPAGFRQGNLATADSVAIAPEWGELFHGRQRFRLIALRGISISLEKNGRGVWNYGQLQQTLAAKKPSATGTFIRELAVKDGSLKVQGQGVQGIALHVFNLTTKGSLDSIFDLAFQDAAGNRYLLKGKGRSGADAALDFSLTAPAISLQETARVLKLADPELYQGGRGSIQVGATLRKEELSTIGDISFTGMHLPAVQKSYPIEGALHFAADYNFDTDAARLKSSTLAVRNLVRLQASATVSGVKKERDYSADLRMEEVDLGTLNFLMPEATRNHLLLGGKLRCDALHLEGDAGEGLVTATGTVQLRDGVALAADGRLLVEGLAGDLSFSRQGAGILANGKLSVSGRHEKALLEELAAPVNLILTSKLKLLEAELPALTARVSGIPFSGRLGFDAEKMSPFTASLKVLSAKFSALNGELNRFGIQASSGTASAVLEAAGKNAQEMTVAAKVRLADVRGTRGKNAFGLKRGAIDAKLDKRGGHLLAQGDARLTALALDGHAGNTRFGFRIDDKMLHLDGLRAGFAGADVRISHLSTPIPRREVAGALTRYPVSADLEGCAIKDGDLEAANLSGRLRGSFNTDSAGSWLDGSADLVSRTVNWRGAKVAAPVLHAVFSRAVGKADLTGQLLGGRLAGFATFNPFAPASGAAFDLGVTGAGLGAAADFLAKGAALRPTQGVADLRVKGTYAEKSGLNCRFESKGSGISLVSGGKTLVSGAGLTLTGAVAGAQLNVANLVLTAAPGVAVMINGDIVQPLSPKRRGGIVFSLPETSINALVDPFANILPRFLQEATVDGTLAADGKIDLHDGRQLLEAALTVKNGRLEVASQKFVVSAFNGRLPFSMDLAGKGGGRPQEAMSFSRENYPRLLAKMRQNSVGGELVTVGRISFGVLDLDNVSMHLSAVNGVTRIGSLRATIYDGTLLGKGYVTMQQKLAYRTDLLINNLSLRTLCSKIANLQGYISGKVDGVASLSGEGSGVGSMTGFANLWAREAKGEQMLVSKEFLQRLSKQKLSGFFFRSDRAYDKAEIEATLQEGDLTFETLTIQHTNFFGVRDLSVSIAPAQNRIDLEHLLDSIKEASVRGKAATGAQPAEQAPASQEFKWGE